MNGPYFQTIQVFLREELRTSPKRVNWLLFIATDRLWNTGSKKLSFLYKWNYLLNSNCVSLSIIKSINCCKGPLSIISRNMFKLACNARFTCALPSEKPVMLNQKVKSAELSLVALITN